MLLYKAGRALQVIGMILLPVAIAGNLVPEQPLDLRASLTLSGVGVAVFALGYLLQQAGRPQ
jgi:predicted acyltransferase